MFIIRNDGRVFCACEGQTRHFDNSSGDSQIFYCASRYEPRLHIILCYWN